MPARLSREPRRSHHGARYPRWGARALVAAPWLVAAPAGAEEPPPGAEAAQPTSPVPAEPAPGSRHPEYDILGDGASPEEEYEPTEPLGRLKSGLVRIGYDPTEEHLDLRRLKLPLPVDQAEIWVSIRQGAPLLLAWSDALPGQERFGDEPAELTWGWSCELTSATLAPEVTRCGDAMAELPEGTRPEALLLVLPREDPTGSGVTESAIVKGVHGVLLRWNGRRWLRGP